MKQKKENSFNPTPLCKIGEIYGTDKCPQIRHHYTPFYYKLFKNKINEVKKVLEIGIGYYKDIENKKVVYDRGLNRFYHRGASLYMWRDFFPNATIFGADIKKESLFTDQRIKTFWVDERDPKSITELIKKVGNDIDIVIDDASHKVNDQIFLASNILPHLKKGSIYIIEDVGHSRKITQALKDYGKGYVYDEPRKQSGEMLYIVEL